MPELATIADRRKPLLFLGTELSAFLEARRSKNKRRLLPGQIYCLACRDVKEPVFGEVEYLRLTPTSGNLRGSTCTRLIHRRASHANLAAVLGQLKVTFTDAPLSIRDTGDPSANSDFELMVAK